MLQSNRSALNAQLRVTSPWHDAPLCGGGLGAASRRCLLAPSSPPNFPINQPWNLQAIPPDKIPCTDIQVIFKLNMTFGWELVGLHTSANFWCMLKGSVEVWMENIIYWCIRIKLILACQEVLKRDWPSMNQSRPLFIQIQTLNPSMRHKWKETTDIVCKTTNKISQWKNSQQKVPLSWKITLLSWGI